MIIIKTDRQQLEAVEAFFLPYLQQLKRTQISNVQHHYQMSAEVLFVIAINCLLDEVDRSIKKKLLSENRSSMKLKYSTAEGIALYRALISLPLPPEQIYLQNVRENFIAQIDQQLTQNNILQTAHHFGNHPTQLENKIFDAVDFDD